MTERKKPGVTFESFVDKQIREAQERGAFENLEGAGKPIPKADTPDDDLWWVKGFLARENLSTDALLPQALQLRKEIERLPATLGELRLEDSVRDALADLNARIVGWIRAPSPPLLPLSPVDVDEWVRQWKIGRAVAERSANKRPEPRPEADVPSTRPRTWWRKMFAREPKPDRGIVRWSPPPPRRASPDPGSGRI
ncbi:MAG: DUF1992 domain-containing protein [Rhodococcus sp. (in: high G+C Gram-positive bacteria)]